MQGLGANPGKFDSECLEESSELGNAHSAFWSKLSPSLTRRRMKPHFHKPDTNTSPGRQLSVSIRLSRNTRLGLESIHMHGGNWSSDAGRRPHGRESTNTDNDRRLTTTEVVSQAMNPLQDVRYSPADTGHMAVFWGLLR